MARDANQGRTDPTWRFLTDEQQAAIAWADPAESSPAIARRIGRSPETVKSMRRRLARDGGWGCPLRWTTCAACGEAAGDRDRRPGAAVPRRLRAGAAQGPGADLDAGAGAALVGGWIAGGTRRRPGACCAARTARDYALTTPRADRHKARWTEEDDAALVDHLGVPDRETALAVVERVVQLLGDLRPGLAVVVLAVALAALPAEVHRGDPQAVLPLVDAALALAAGPALGHCSAALLSSPTGCDSATTDPGVHSSSAQGRGVSCNDPAGPSPQF